MVEVRVDEATGDWSVLAPRRAARPDDDRHDPRHNPAPATLPRSAGGSPACPFCWGNEAMTPPEVLRVPAGAADWRVRVVPNLYAAVDPRDDPRAEPRGEAVAEPRGGAVPGPAPTPELPLPLTGRHEVLVESGRHDWDLRRGDPDEVATILFAMRERYRTLAAEGRLAHEPASEVPAGHGPAAHGQAAEEPAAQGPTAQGPGAISVFRNYGARAGASLVHPHSQIVALDQVPPGLLQRWRRAREYHDRTGTCLRDAVAAAERRDGERIVLDLDGVLVYQPRAASVPHQTTLLPAERAAGLADASDETLTVLAGVLPRVLAGLAEVLDDPAYNLVVHSGPVGDPAARDWYRWHITIYPRVTTVGGLEIATGIAVNPSTPEQTAGALRAQLTTG